MSTGRAFATKVFSRWSKQKQVENLDEHRRSLLADSPPLSRSYGTIYNSPLEVHYEEESRPFDIGPSGSPSEGPVYHGGAPFMHGDSDDEEDWELEREGLYRGSYVRSMLLYSIVPLFAFLWFTLVALVPYTFYPLHPGETPPSVPHLPFPLPEILLSVSLWSLSHILRVPIYMISSTLTPSTFPSLTTILFAFLTSTLTNVLRIIAVPFLNLKITNHPTTTEPAFRCVWWFALAWAAADVIVGVYQGYDAISLYKDSFVDPKARGLSDEEIALNGKRPAIPHTSSDLSSPAESVSGLPVSSGSPPTFFVGDEPPAHHQNPVLQRAMNSQTTLEEALDQDLEQLVSLQRREELELIYGTPFVRIPVFVSCLLRLDTLFSTLGFTLLTSAAYLRYTVRLTQSNTPHLFTSMNSSHQPHTQPWLEASSHHVNALLPLLITFPCVVVAHTLLSSLSISPFLARVGVHSAAYVGVLVGLGAWFAGMGAWEAVA